MAIIAHQFLQLLNDYGYEPDSCRYLEPVSERKTLTGKVPGPQADESEANCDIPPDQVIHMIRGQRSGAHDRCAVIGQGARRQAGSMVCLTMKSRFGSDAQ